MPRVCQRAWTSDPARLCRAKSVGGDVCIAHHDDPPAALRAAVDNDGELGLVGCEITAELWRALLQLVSLDESIARVDCADATFVDPLRATDLEIDNEMVRSVDWDFEMATFLEMVAIPVQLFTGSEEVCFDGATFRSAVSFWSQRFHGPRRRTVIASSDGSSVRRDDSSMAGSVSFIRATFHERADFTGATFDEVAVIFDAATFHAEARFNDTSFVRALVSFVFTTFAGRAYSCDVEFGPSAHFHLSTFGDHAEFVRLTISPEHKSLIFNSVRFGRTTELDVRCTLPWAVRLTAASWSGPSELLLSSSGADVELQGCVIDQPLTIGRSRYNAHKQARHRLEVQRHPRPGGADDQRQGALVGILSCTLLAPVTIYELSLEGTAFAGSTGLDQLRFATAPTWATIPGRPSRQGIADEAQSGVFRRPGRPWHRDANVAALYRQLRAGLEASKAAPAAADFYVGEPSVLEACSTEDFSVIGNFLAGSAFFRCCRPTSEGHHGTSRTTDRRDHLER